MKRFFKIARAFIVRDLRFSSTYRFAFLRELIGVVFTSAIFFFIARLVSSGLAQHDLAGENYFAFVILGIGMASFIGISLTAMVHWIRQEQYLGTMEPLCLAPVPWSVMALASGVGRYLRASFTVLLYLLVGLFFGLRIVPAGLGAALILFLLAMGVFVSLGFFSAGLLLAFKQGCGSLRLLAGNMGNLFGGVYFPVALLPAGLTFVSYLLPVTYALTGLRKSLLTGSGITAVQSEIAVLLLFFVVSAPLSLFFLNWSLKKARRDGTLFQI